MNNFGFPGKQRRAQRLGLVQVSEFSNDAVYDPANQQSPCDYREPDVAEYGSCYCGLYVSKAYNQGEIEPKYVPERRDPDKMA